MAWFRKRKPIRHVPTELVHAQFTGYGQKHNYTIRKFSTIEEQVIALERVRDQVDLEIRRIHQSEADRIGENAWMLGMEFFVEQLEDNR